MKTSSRFLWADGIRVLAIFLVVLTHSIGISFPQDPSTSDHFFHVFFRSLVRVAIPLFVMLSGALLLSKRESAIFFYRKRLLKLVLPWVFWTVIVFFWNIGSNAIPYDSAFVAAKDLYVIFMSHYWFLPMLTGLYLLTPLLREVLEKTSRLVLWGSVGIWIGFISLLPLLTSTLSQTTSISPYYILEHLGYYLLGYLLTTSKLTFSQLTTFLFFSLSLTCHMLLLLSQQLFILPKYVYLDHNASFFIIVASVSAFVFLKNYLEKTKLALSLRKGITHTALVSFGIFLTHDLLRSMVTSRGVGESFMTIPLPYPLAVLIQTTSIFLLSGSIIFLLRKTRVGKHLAT